MLRKKKQKQQTRSTAGNSNHEPMVQDTLSKLAERSIWEQERRQHEALASGSASGSNNNIAVKREPSIFDHDLSLQFQVRRTDAQMENLVVKQEPSIVDHDVALQRHDQVRRTADTQVEIFFRARGYGNPIVLGNLKRAEFTKYELKSMKGLNHALVADRFRLILPAECQGAAQIESLAFAVAYASEEDWMALDA